MAAASSRFRWKRRTSRSTGGPSTTARKAASRSQTSTRCSSRARRMMATVARTEPMVAQMVRQGTRSRAVGPGRMVTGSAPMSLDMVGPLPSAGAPGPDYPVRWWSGAPAEERPDVVDQQAGLFQGGEVAAPVHLGPVHDVVVPLGEAAHRRGDVAGEHGDARRHLQARAVGEGGARLEIQPGRRSGGAGEPVEHHVGEDAVTG